MFVLLFSEVQFLYSFFFAEVFAAIGNDTALTWCGFSDGRVHPPSGRATNVQPTTTETAPMALRMILDSPRNPSSNRSCRYAPNYMENAENHPPRNVTRASDHWRVGLQRRHSAAGGRRRRRTGSGGRLGGRAGHLGARVVVVVVRRPLLFVGKAAVLSARTTSSPAVRPGDLQPSRHPRHLW